MFVNILRIASPLEFSLPSFLSSRKRSLFSSFKKTVFSDIEFSNFFLFFEIKQGFFNSSIQKNHSIHDSTTILLQLSIFLAYFDSNIYTLKCEHGA